MFPIRDDNPTQRTPVITIAIIAACVAVWILVQGSGWDSDLLERSVCLYGAIPSELIGRPSSAAGPCSLGGLTWTALVTSMFLHGGWVHLIGNMWFLWIFGNNVEDSMGRGRFSVFYILCGVLAALAHVFTSPGSPLPMVGASGAIGGIMGAYLLLYPGARVRTLLVLIIFITFVDLPAWLYLGYWLVLQVVSQQLQVAGSGGGVAFGAHVGGFAAGFILILFFRNPKLMRAKRARAEP